MTVNPVLAALINARVTEITAPPRSWDNEAKAAFLQLPPNLQRYYAKREAQRDKEVRRMHTVADDLRKEIADLKAKLANYEEASVAEVETQE